MIDQLACIERTIRARLAAAEPDSPEWHRWMIELRNVMYLRSLGVR